MSKNQTYSGFKTNLGTVPGACPRGNDTKPNKKANRYRRPKKQERQRKIGGARAAYLSIRFLEFIKHRDKRKNLKRILAKGVVLGLDWWR